MWVLILIPALIYLIIQLWLVWAVEKIQPIKLIRTENLPPLSVIIAARNAAEYLRENLHSILNQSYPSFEVIVVLDRCTDDSARLIRQLQQEYTHLKMLEIQQVPENWASKKWALTQAIRQAKYDCLVFTDADCKADENWLRTTGMHFHRGAEIVLGLGLYDKYPGLLNAFIRFETFYTAFQFIGMAVHKMPYMAVGRNLAYRRTFFEKHKGFSCFQSRISGDDDLLINAFGKHARLAVMVEKDSRTLSEPKLTLKSWIKQKRRHLSASQKYSLKSKLFLGLFHFSHMGFYLGILLCLTGGSTIALIFALYIVRLLSSWCLFIWANKKLQFQQMLFLFPVLDLLFFIYNLTVVPIGLITNKPEWI